MCVLPYCTVLFIGPLCPDIVYVNSMSVACCLVVSPLQELEIVASRAPYVLVIEHFISQDSYLFFTHAPSERSVGLQMDFLFSSSSSSTPLELCFS